MKLVNVLTNNNFNTYIKELIANAETSFNFVPGEGLRADRIEKLGCIRQWISTILNTEFVKMGINARINAARIAAGDANKPDAWIDVLRSSGILHRVKAHNRLSHYLTKADDEFNDGWIEMYYNVAGDRTHAYTKGGIKFAINRFSNDVSSILRLGAAFLSENDKAKIKFHLSMDKSFLPAISFTEDEVSKDTMVITIRNGYRDNGDMQRISKQIIAALSRMKVVRHSNMIIETSSQHRIAVTFNTPKTDNTVVETSMTPVKAHKTIETPVDINKAIQAKINELEEEFNELEMKKRNLNDEVSRISSRTIQLKRQMETLKISLGIISEPKAGV